MDIPNIVPFRYSDDNQIDVKETIYMKQPNRFEDLDNPEKVCILRKAAPRS